ncbi:pleckstrin y domain containing, M (with RUN domain) member 2 [Chamberlinius hualienensis]
MSNEIKHEIEKDRLLDNCSEAIKQLQLESCHLPENTSFTSDMWQVEDLYRRLDSTFKHGLKRVSDGYWLFVRKISHKSVVAIIDNFPNVQADSEKGYAWLHLAINDHTLESYLQFVMSDQTDVKKFYMPNAMLRDLQRLNVLVMLLAGLEHLPLSITWDDFCKFRRGSVCTVSSEPDCDSDVEEADCTSLESYNLNDEQSLKESIDDDDDDPEIAAVTLVTFDPKTGLPIKFIQENEVVHSSTRMTRKRKKPNSINNNNNNVNLEIDPQKTVVNYKNNIATRLMTHRIEQADREKFLKSILNNQTNLFKKDASNNESDTVLKSPVRGAEEKSLYDQIETDKKIEILSTNLRVVKLNSEESLLDMSERGVPEGQEDPMSISSVSSNIKKPVQVNNKLEAVVLPFPQFQTVSESIVKENTAKLTADISSEVVDGKEQQKQQHNAGEVILDNNFLLIIMLQVIADQDEKVYKVYRGMTGHTVGVPSEIFVVITDQRLYLVRWIKETKCFDIIALVTHSEIEFIQLGLNGQFVNIVCVAPRRRFWISTGDEDSSQNIVSSLEFTMRRNPKVLKSGLPSVYSQNTMQCFVFRKWIAEQLNLDDFESIKISHYAMIRWEDPHAINVTSQLPVRPTKEGFLMYQYSGSKTTFGDENLWRPAFFRLKAGVFYHFNDPLDKMFRSYVQLTERECTGCRRLHNMSRPYTFEMLLANNRSLRLAASSEEEASQWLQEIVLTVAQGPTHKEMNYSSVKSACIIMAENSLFICHEQLESNTLSLLAKASLLDVSSVHLDPSPDSKYCVMEFELVEATESSGDWVLYFISENELQKFISILKSEWRDLYQVPLTVNHELDSFLQKRFSSTQHLFSCNHESPIMQN